MSQQPKEPPAETPDPTTAPHSVEETLSDRRGRPLSGVARLAYMDPERHRELSREAGLKGAAVSHENRRRRKLITKRTP
jgi:hypothetical protein